MPFIANYNIIIFDNVADNDNEMREICQCPFPKHRASLNTVPIALKEISF
jgi:hypothetical protein